MTVVDEYKIGNETLEQKIANQIDRLENLSNSHDVRSYASVLLTINFETGAQAISNMKDFVGLLSKARVSMQPTLPILRFYLWQSQQMFPDNEYAESYFSACINFLYQEFVQRMKDEIDSKEIISTKIDETARQELIEEILGKNNNRERIIHFNDSINDPEGFRSIMNINNLAVFVVGDNSVREKISNLY